VTRPTSASGLELAWWHRPKWDRPKWDRPKWDRPKRDRPKRDRPKWDRPKWDRPKWDRPKWDRPIRLVPPSLPHYDALRPAQAADSRQAGLLLSASQCHSWCVDPGLRCAPEAAPPARPSAQGRFLTAQMQPRLKNPDAPPPPAAAAAAAAAPAEIAVVPSDADGKTRRADTAPRAREGGSKAVAEGGAWGPVGSQRGAGLGLVPTAPRLPASGGRCRTRPAGLCVALPPRPSVRPGADVGGVSPTPGADRGRARPVPAQMWEGLGALRLRRREPLRAAQCSAGTPHRAGQAASRPGLGLRGFGA
jgi:hypothetical protein